MSGNEYSSPAHNIEQEADQEKENHIVLVKIKSINSNTICPIITANLKTPSKKVIIMVPYKV